MNLYLYWDNSKKPRKLLGAIEEEGVCKADRLFEKFFGFNPIQKHISFEIYRKRLLRKGYIKV